MNTRFASVALALVLAFLAGSAKAEGVYQRTADNKTMIWNSFPMRGETMSWSGKQDKEDYATGSGELTFHKKTGFTFARHDVVTERYSGKMVRGKFEGTVETVNKNGETSHATFVAGKRTGDWEPGPAPKASEKTTPKSAAAQPPAEGPTENVPPASAGDGPRRGNSQLCPPGQTCAFECPEGGCAFSCAEGSTCNVECDGGRCKLACGINATCNIECDGGQCGTGCGAGATCNMECDGGQCASACAPDASCNSDCDGGDCS